MDQIPPICDEGMEFNILSDHDYDGLSDVAEKFKDAVDGDRDLKEEGKRKRLHGVNSEEEGWNTVSRGRKSVRKSLGNEGDEKVCVTSSSPLPKQFALARLFKENKIGGITRIKYIHQLKMLMTFEEESDADNFIKCEAWNNLGWRCQKTSEVGICYGVIKNIDLDVSEEEIMMYLRCDAEVIGVKRLNMRKHDGDVASGWVKCESVRLAFKGPSPPSHIFIHDMRIKVESFIFPVTQCSRCWKFGHTRMMCPSKKVVCPKCSKGHENCESTSYRCVNCTGNHMALQKVCPVFKKERRIRELMSESNCTYKRATGLYVPPLVPVRSLSPGPAVVPPCRVVSESAVPVKTSCDQPSRSVRLFSELFSLSEPAPPVPPAPSSEGSPFELVQGRKKRRRRPLSSASGHFSAEVPQQMEDECCNDVPRSEANASKSDIPKTSQGMDFGFMRLLMRLKEILMSRQSLEDKIREGFSVVTEWIVSKVASFFSVGSLLSLFINNG